MAEAPNPRNWGEVPDWFIWGCLVLACAFELVGGIVVGEWGRALAALLLAIGPMTMGFYWRNVNPNWAIPAAVTLILVIALSPFVEQRRWPFATGISRADYDTVTKERNDLLIKLADEKKVNDALLSAQARSLPVPLIGGSVNT